MHNHNKIWEYVYTPITKNEIEDLRHNIENCHWMFSDSAGLNFMSKEAMRLINHIEILNKKIDDLSTENLILETTPDWFRE